MIRVVFDTSVVASAIFWPRSTARKALAMMARRKVHACVTDEIEREYLKTCLEIQDLKFPDRAPVSFLNWISHKALHCVPAPLGKQRSRDENDDPFIACALAAQAKFVVSSDKDLLSLGIGVCT